MADGKLQIKGTITIKGGGKEKKKKRKPRKKKTTAKEPYTGIPLGTAQTKQEFSPPYTAQALMTAFSLRPQIQAQTMEQPQKQQQTIEQPKYYQLEDIQYIPPESSIQMTKREFMSKAAPFLERGIQQGIEEKKQELERALEEQQYTAQLRMQELQSDFVRAEQFYENAMEEKQKQFQKELADMELRAKTEKERMDLERIHDKAEFVAQSVIDKGLFNIQSKSQQQQLAEQQKELKQTKTQIEESKKIAEIERINSLSTATLQQELKKIDPSLLTDENGNLLTTDDLRLTLLYKKGLAKYITEIPQTGGRGRPTIKYQYKRAAVDEE